MPRWSLYPSRDRPPSVCAVYDNYRGQLATGHSVIRLISGNGIRASSVTGLGKITRFRGRDGSRRNERMPGISDGVARCIRMLPLETEVNLIGSPVKYNIQVFAQCMLN